MEVNFIYFILGIVLILSIVIIYNVSIWMMRKFEKSSVKVLQATIFHSPKILYYGTISFLAIYFLIILIIDFNFPILFCFMICLFLYFNKNLYQRLIPKFEYNKYNTSVQYYQSVRNENYKFKVYGVMLNEIKNLDWSKIKNEEHRKDFLKYINPKWEQILSYEFFNEKISKSRSSISIGELSCNFLILNSLTIMNKFYKADSKSKEENHLFLKEIFNSPYALKFNDMDGFYFDTNIINDLNESKYELFNKHRIFEKFNELKFIIDNSNSLVKDVVSAQLDDMKFTIENNSIVNSRHLLPDNVSEKILYQQLVMKFQDLSEKRKRDLKLFVKINFKNSKGRGMEMPSIYNDFKFLESNAVLIGKIIFNTKAMNITKLDCAKILAKEFNLNVKTVQDKL